MSSLPSYSSATTRPAPETDESINLRNNNVINQQQEIQQTQHQKEYPLQTANQDPPYLIRNSRAFRHFKNPPQPHMCIKDHTDDGQELFINVMSWTKICMPHSETDPIPLYGGMRVTSSSPKSPPLMFAVMANPAILKHVGRKCSDVEEKFALISLLLDFVEAMNPGLKLARDAEVLKDRDLSGELKDIWSAVQAKRLREKDSAPSYESYLASQHQVYIEFGPPGATQNHPQQIVEQPKQMQLLEVNYQKEPDIHSVLNIDEVDNNIPQHAVDRQNKLNAPDKHAANSINIAHKNINESTKNITVPSTENDSNKQDRQLWKKDKLSGFLPNSCHNIFPFIKTKSSGNDQKDNRTIQQQQNKNMSRKMMCDTEQLEGEISKLDIGKIQ